MHKKRGQVTLFIIIGIVVLFLFAIVFQYIRAMSDVQQPSESFDSFTKYVTACIEKSSAEAGYYIVLHGGMQQVPARNVNFLYMEEGNPVLTQATLFSDKSSGRNIYMPSHSEMEDNYAERIKRDLFDCVDDFSVYEKMGYNISYTEPRVYVDIERDYSLIDVKFDINVSLGNSHKSFESFASERVPLRLGRLYDAGERIVNSNNPHIDATYARSLENQDINAYAFHMPSQDSWIYVIQDVSEPLKEYNKKHNSGQYPTYIFGEHYG